MPANCSASAKSRALARRLEALKTTRIVFVAWALAALLTAFVNPLFAQKIKIDYDKKINFSGFKTYVWVPGTAVANPKLDAYIKNVASDCLRHAGLKEAPFSEADLAVTYHAATDGDLSVGTAIDPTYSASGGVIVPGQSIWAVNGGSSAYVEKGSLTFEILDKKANRIIWTGTAKGTLKDKASERWDQAANATGKLFDRYPPGKH